MRLLTWLRGQFGDERPASIKRRRRAKRIASTRSPLRVESLEDRTLMAAGMLDPTFGSGGIANPAGKNFHGIAYGLAVYSDAQPTTAGDIVTAGWISKKQTTDFGVVRYTSGGQPDPTFGDSGTVKISFKGSNGSQAGAVAIQPDGNVVAAGTATSSTTGADFALARINVNGSLDTSFGSKGKVVTNLLGNSDSARDLLIQPDGKIVVVGTAMPGYPATTNLALVRYNANGSLDTSFGSGGKVVMSHTVIPGSYVDPAGKYGNTWVSDTVLQQDGRILVSGYTEVTNGLLTNPVTYNTYEAFVLRYNTNGALDASFGVGGAVTLPPKTDPDGSLKGSAGRLALAPDGEIVITGFNQLALLHADGSLDTSFAGGGIAPYGSGVVAVQANGDIVTASGDTGLVSRFLPDGTPDTTFGNSGTEKPILGSATALAIQPDGNILEASGFTIARLLPGEPQIGSFTASSETLLVGGSVMLTAAGVTDSNPSSSVTQVAIYAQVNGASTLLGQGTQTSPGTWTFTLSRPAGWTPGTYTISAQAKDNYGVVGEPLSLDLTVL